jgi:hypothetical protein
MFLLKVSAVKTKLKQKFYLNYFEFITGRTIKVTYTAGAGNKDDNLPF